METLEITFKITIPFTDRLWWSNNYALLSLEAEKCKNACVPYLCELLWRMGLNREKVETLKLACNNTTMFSEKLWWSIIYALLRYT